MQSIYAVYQLQVDAIYNCRKVNFSLYICLKRLNLIILLRPFSRTLTGPIFGPIPNAKLKFFFPIEKINSQLKKIKHILIKINQINIELESCKTCSSSLEYDVHTSN